MAANNALPVFTPVAQEEEKCTDMNNTAQEKDSHWFAIKTPQDFKAEEALKTECEEVFFPTNLIRLPQGKSRKRAVIPHVLFIKTTRENALTLELKGRKDPPETIPFWIFRYPKNPEIQVISQKSIDLLKLLTSDDTSECRVYNPTVFTPGEYVKITGGMYEGYEGFVKRINRDRRVVVEIEGVCMVILPFIHPDLLIKKSDNLPLTDKRINNLNN